FRKSIADLGEVPFGMVSGRFYAMDRDKRWDRVASACQALIDADAPVAGDPVTAIEDSYAQGITDEFVEPVVMAGYEGMKDGDGVFMINYRADRVREILLALLDPDFDGFARARTVSFAAALGMSEYSTRHNRLMRTMFPPEMRERLLGEVISKAGLKQLRVAETEKYAHVTFFFNGGREDAWPGEERILIPSPKVKTYDFQPEMSAPELTDKLVAAINADTFDLIVVNFANSDMVGHTGILSAAIKAIETVDTCIGRLETAILAKGGALVITADHGNAEVMFDPVTNGPHTAHTLNPVPVILVGGPEGVRLHTGKLADLAPTVLALMGISQPPDMTGHSLID
ncbi:MAG: 2,3-bisphosphoglycerate-independent phosphoglycerate mutase, partial [Pseudomonadota bacterium]|nr:2,3-bisphosphoglycerate-independent phosphoglycerate mutase [Pseudomonadota bacterium]